MPGAGGVGVDPVLLHLHADPAKQLPGVLERGLVLLGGQLAQAPVEVELALGDAEVHLRVDPGHPVEESGAERLAQGDRVVLARHGGDEAAVELDRLELHAVAADAALDGVARALQRLDVEDRHHRREVGHVGLGQHRAGQHLPAAEQPAAALALVGVARRAPELVVELPGQPVRPAGAERRRPAARVEAADRLVGDPAGGRHPADHICPRGRAARGLHVTRPR